MPIHAAALIVDLLTAYLSCGLVFVATALPRLVTRLDPGLRGATFGVRLILAPGLAAMWPLFAWRLLRGAATPVERNAHRDRARPHAERPGSTQGPTS